MKKQNLFKKSLNDSCNSREDQSFNSLSSKLRKNFFFSHFFVIEKRPFSKFSTSFLYEPEENTSKVPFKIDSISDFIFPFALHS